jgi:hypothetical protein
MSIAAVAAANMGMIIMGRNPIIVSIFTSLLPFFEQHSIDLTPLCLVAPFFSYPRIFQTYSIIVNILIPLPLSIALWGSG